MKSVIRILPIIAAVLIADQASAIPIAPPSRFRDPALQTVPVSVTFMPLLKLQGQCGNSLFPIATIYGCAKRLSARCIVFTIDKTYPYAGFPFGPPIITPAAALDHEMAHCAGWHRSHPYD